MGNLRNWLLSGLICIGGYLFFVLVVFGQRDIPLLWRLEEWWARGGFCVLIALAVGYFFAQIIGRGTLSPTLLWRGGFLYLVPFLFLGNCAGQGYQGARALGWIGVGTGLVAKTLAKDYSVYAPNEYRLIVRDPQDGVVEWEMHDGKIVMGTEVLVSREAYDEHVIGTFVSVVDLPGGLYPSHRLKEAVEERFPESLVFATAWAVVALFGLRQLRKESCAIERNVEEGRYSTTAQAGRLTAGQRTSWRGPE